MAHISLSSIGFLVLFFSSYFTLEAEGAKLSHLSRAKREWVIPPQKLEENVDYTRKPFIAKIRSDREEDIDHGKGPLRYFLRGIGADEEPVNLFIVNRETGYVQITGILDREKIAVYNLSGVAQYANKEYAEKDIELRVQVLDQNDCKPVFQPQPPGTVDELSPIGKIVMDVLATDDDEPGNKNSKIAYSIVKQDPAGEDMFGIHKNGSIYVKSPKLDRETLDTYFLTVRGKDLDGAQGGHTSSGTVTIKLTDVNDNAPRLEREHYEGNVDENTVGVEIMRFKALDDDIEKTDNWLAEFAILSGNEAGYFEIETDEETNEGVLKVVKPIDYEDLHDLDLQVALANKADFHPSVQAGAGGDITLGHGDGGGGGGGSAGGSSGSSSSSSASGGGGGGGGGGGSSSYRSKFRGKPYPVKINVNNIPEGPMFSPKVKAVPLSEDSKSVNLKDVITKYPAIDGDTKKEAERVRYVKGHDPDNWLVIDEKTAEVRLNKMPDRESKYLVNGTYMAKILCISEDMPYKTATGTIAIQVEDHNDHCPKLTATSETLCSDEKTVIVTAIDEDDFPNSAPFLFTLIPKETTGEWAVENLNATSVILRAQDNLWPGVYSVAMEVADQQGQACPDKQVMEVQVCTCEAGICGQRGKTTGAALGGAGIGLLLLGLLMLALIPLLLLFCNSGGAGAGGIGGGFSDMPFDNKEHLITYHTEGKGEDQEVPMLSAPLESMMPLQAADVGGLQAAGRMGGASWGASQSMGAANMYQSRPSGRMDVDFMSREELVSREQVDAAYAAGYEAEGHMHDGIALSEEYLGQYYSQRAACIAEGSTQKDSLLMYDFEGTGSLAGSVGCCSILETDNNLEFLNDLGPKFKTLASICKGREVVAESAAAASVVMAAPPPPAPIQEVSSSAMISEQSMSSVNISNMAASAPAASAERSMVVENNYMATLPKMNIQESVVIPSQTYMVQQPMYYTTAQVVQPMHYVMEPQVQNMYVVDAPVAENVVLQERRVIGGPALHGGVIGGPALHGGVIGVQQGTLNRGENVVLVERQMGSGQLVQDGGVVGHNQGMVLLEGQMGAGQLVREGGLVGHNQGLMLVEGQMGSGQVLQGGQTWIQQGTLPRGTLSGSQVLLVEREGVAGQAVHNGIMTQGKEVIMEKGSLHSPTSLGGPLQRTGVHSSQKVVVREKKVISS